MLGDDSLRADGNARNLDDRDHNNAISLLALVENRPEICDLWLNEQDWQPRPAIYSVGSIAALADFVSLEEFVGAARYRIDSLEGLAPRLARHAAILHCVMRWSPVFPIPFGTLYRTAEGLLSFMHRHQDQIVAFLKTVAGKEEWMLKATATIEDPGRLEELARRSWSDWQALTPGTRYMRMCRDRQSLAARAREEARVHLAHMVAGLQPVVAAIKVYEEHASRGRNQTEMIGSYALLVDRMAARQFHDRMQELCAQAAMHDIAISLSGPWPPFAFRPPLA